MRSGDAGDGGGKRSGGGRPANDNSAPKAQDNEDDNNASERLDAVVLSVARLIGRQMARHDHQTALCAANDNAKPRGDGSGPGSDDPKNP